MCMDVWTYVIRVWTCGRTDVCDLCMDVWTWTWMRGRMDVWTYVICVTYGRMDVWTRGRMDAWARGRMDAWARGRMDAWKNTRNQKLPNKNVCRKIILSNISNI